jgi:hypothetical protein
MTSYKTDPFWANDIKILFQANRLGEILPMNNMSTTKKLNAILRCSVYFSVIHYLAMKNSNILFIPVCVSIFQYVFYINNTEKSKYNKLGDVIEKMGNKLLGKSKNDKNKQNDNPLFESSIYNDNNWSNNDLSNLQDTENIRDDYEDNDCKLPSVDNPFGNVMLGDIGNSKFKKACSSYNNNMVKRDMKRDFEDGLFLDANDMYSKHNSQRQFYTMPNTGIVNDQGGFAKWCYMTPPTCKEGNAMQCSANLSNSNGLNTSELLLDGPGGGAPPSST